MFFTNSEYGYFLEMPKKRKKTKASKKPKKKLTPAQRAEKKRRKKEFMTIFIGGKQKRVRRPPTVDGMDPEEFIRRNADPLWLHQNEMWEYIQPEAAADEPENSAPRLGQGEDDEVPF